MSFSVTNHDVLFKYLPNTLFSDFCFCVLCFSSPVPWATNTGFSFYTCLLWLSKRLRLTLWGFAFSLTTTIFLLRLYLFLQRPSKSMTVVRHPLNSVTLSSRSGKHGCSLSSVINKHVEGGDICLHTLLGLWPFIQISTFQVFSQYLSFRFHFELRALPLHLFSWLIYFPCSCVCTNLLDISILPVCSEHVL